jgi:hypothetical protein
MITREIVALRAAVGDWPVRAARAIRGDTGPEPARHFFQRGRRFVRLETVVSGSAPSRGVVGRIRPRP